MVVTTVAIRIMAMVSPSKRKKQTKTMSEVTDTEMKILMGIVS